MSANVAIEDIEDGPPGRRSLIAALWSERMLWGLAAIVFAWLIAIGLFRGITQLSLLETTVNDYLRITIAERADGQDKRVSIVALNEETLVQFPYRSPVDRAYLAELVGAINEAGAAAIVLDVLFDQPTEAEKDDALIAAIRAFQGPVVAAWGDARAGLIPQQVAYLEEFGRRAGIEYGFANVVTDEDGAVRRFKTVLPGIDKISMSGTMAKLVSGAEPMREGVIDWAQPKTAGATLFQQWPALRVTEFAKNPAVKRVLSNGLGGRVVFIGADLEQRDRHQTSLSISPANSRTIPGVVIQAFVFTQLLDGRVVPNASAELVYAIVAALAVMGALIGLSKLNLGWKALGVGAALGAYVGAVYFLAQSATLFLPVAPALAALFLAFMLAISLDSFLTQKDERFIRLAFSHYLEPSMVDQLAEDPQALRLGGDRREMSLLFTDIEGFTRMSEELSPDQLTRLLNDYFDGMSDIIMAHGGAIDKFIGDAVVAHFGAPRPMEDHALRALQCAAELDKFGELFRRKNAHLGLGMTRIGLHSGIATVGNFGGRARFDYTAIGDAVNTAARLESSNKKYGTRVGVSQETAELAGAMAGPGDKLPLLQTIGKIMLKGKAKPVTVYTINNDADEEFVWAYEAAFSLIEVNVDKAKAALNELFRTNPNDPLVKWRIARLEKGETDTML